MRERWKISKNNRVLELYERFLNGEIINKSEEAQRFGVDERTIQRDIDDIRSFLQNNSLKGENREIIYDRKRNGFVICKHQK
ncbi:MAG: hypothetical protein E7265_02870 [Lachnospiraceae bacterium]|nr:hypothetical protein [Lachnospiraceae bacterium]